MDYNGTAAMLITVDPETRGCECWIMNGDLHMSMAESLTAIGQLVGQIVGSSMVNGATGITLAGSMEFVERNASRITDELLAGKLVLGPPMKETVDG